jgi:hypothetical protein
MPCNFPSAALLAYKRQLAIECDRELDESNRRHRMTTVMAIETLRMMHEDIDGCQCWYEAVGEVKR